MKITMYELLRLVKDGKAPKKIIYDKSKYFYNGLEKDYYKYTTKDFKDENIEYLFDYKITEILNDEVEIIEEKEMCHKCHKYPAEYNQTYCEFCLGISKLEEKKIPEKIIPTSLKGIDNLDEKIEIAHIDTISVIETVNQVLDYLKSKGE